VKKKFQHVGGFWFQLAAGALAAPEEAIAVFPNAC